jgi:prepilin-type N-terminal cleavage/methylation domain-containing protein
MKSRGFTLVELLVVIAIIGLLSTVAVVATSSTSQNARNQKRKADLVQLSKALELYYAVNNAYPPTDPSGATHPAWGVCSGSGAFTVKNDSGPNGWIPGLAPTYTAILPRDPRSGLANATSALGTCRTDPNYSCYIYESNGTDYLLAAHCTPEGTISPSDPFYYSGSPGATYMFVIYTPGAKGW